MRRFMGLKAMREVHDMGLTLHSLHGQIDFEMGYGGFFALRTEIAKCVDPDFGEAYGDLPIYMLRGGVWEKRLERIMKEKNIRAGNIIDFLLMPDSVGSVNYRTCKEIYNLIKDIDFRGKRFSRNEHKAGDYEDLKVFLRDCIKNQKSMRWN